VRGNADQRRDLFTRQRPELGQAREQAPRGDTADSWHALPELITDAPDRALPQLLIGLINALFELLDVALEGWTAFGQDRAVLLGHQHLDQLVASGERVGQSLRLLIRQLVGLRFNLLAEVGQNQRFDLVGLGQLAGR